MIVDVEAGFGPKLWRANDTQRPQSAKRFDTSFKNLWPPRRLKRKISAAVSQRPHGFDYIDLFTVDGVSGPKFGGKLEPGRHHIDRYDLRRASHARRHHCAQSYGAGTICDEATARADRKSTRLNSSH